MKKKRNDKRRLIVGTIVLIFVLGMMNLTRAPGAHNHENQIPVSTSLPAESPDQTFSEAELVALNVAVDVSNLLPADRVSPPTTEAPPESTIPTNLFGLPLPPEGLSDCDEFNFFREQFNGLVINGYLFVALPVKFNGLAWRESNCRNEDGVRTGCCFGYLQINVYVHLADPRTGPLYRDICGIYSQNEINSDNPADKWRNVCAATILYSIDRGAWNL